MIEEQDNYSNWYKKSVILACVLFCISNILMLCNPGVYWDDWSIINMDTTGLMNQYYGNGNILFGFLHLLIKEIWASPIFYHALTFLCQFFNILLLFKILKLITLPAKQPNFLSLVIIIFAVFPIHDAKATVIIFPHILCLTFFITGSFLLLKYLKQKQLFLRIFSLLFFLFSFLINSLLLFYILPIFFILFKEYWNQFFSKNYNSFPSLLKEIIYRILKYLDFMVLPFFFWIIKMNFFKPSMQYESIGYNTLKLNALLQIPYKIVVFLYLFIVDLIPILLEAVKHVELWIIFGILSWYIFMQSKKLKLNFTVSYKYILWGLVVLILGAFPYLMVNKYPSYLDYLSRHQLLLGFGASLSFCSLVFLFKSIAIKRLLLTISISGFMVITIFLHFSYFKGYVKQKVFQEYFFSDPFFPSETSQTIILQDHTNDFSKKGQPTKFYAFAGMLKKRYPNENIVLVRPEDLKGYLKLDIFPKIAPYYFQYNLTNYNYVNPQNILEVNYGEKRPLFPIWTYYSDFFTGHPENWNQYFHFNLKPIPKN